MEVNIESMKQIIGKIAYFNESLILVQVKTLKPKSIKALCYLVGLQKEMNDIYTFDLLSLHVDMLDKSEFKAYANSFNEIEKRLKSQIETDVFFGFRINTDKRCVVVTNRPKLEMFQSVIQELTKSKSESVTTDLVTNKSLSKVVSKSSKSSNLSTDTVNEQYRQNRQKRQNRQGRGSEKNSDLVNQDVTTKKWSIRARLGNLKHSNPKVKDFTSVTLSAYFTEDEIAYALQQGWLVEHRKDLYRVNV